MYTVRFSEIILKNKHSRKFASILQQNIVKVLAVNGLSADVVSSHMHSYIDVSDNNILASIFTKMPGISWISSVINMNRTNSVKSDVNNIVAKLLELHKNNKMSNNIFVDVRRNDKSYILTSQELLYKIVNKLKNNGLQVYFRAQNKKLAQNSVIITVCKKHIEIAYSKQRGPSGLPVGVSGKFLVLLSGGIDSPVAAYLMSKRGASIDYLHFSLFKDIKNIEKIRRIVASLHAYGIGGRLFIADCLSLGDAVKSKNIPLSYWSVLFKRYIIQVAKKLLKKYKGLILGDSLGQVSSQVANNMNLLNSLYPNIYRPLIGLNKEEIITVAKNIRTYELSLIAYRDCCTAQSSKGSPYIDVSKLFEYEKAINMPNIVDNALKSIIKYKIDDIS